MFNLGGNQNDNASLITGDTVMSSKIPLIGDRNKLYVNRFNLNPQKEKFTHVVINFICPTFQIFTFILLMMIINIVFYIVMVSIPGG